jgi:hypothetical protein
MCSVLSNNLTIGDLCGKTNLYTNGIFFTMPYICTALGSMFFYLGVLGFPIVWAGFGSGPFYEVLTHQARESVKRDVIIQAMSGAGYPESTGRYNGAFLHTNLSRSDAEILADRLVSIGFGDVIAMAIITLIGAGISGTFSYKLAVFLHAKADAIAPSKTANPEL